MTATAGGTMPERVGARSAMRFRGPLPVYRSAVTHSVTNAFVTSKVETNAFGAVRGERVRLPHGAP
ncbi:hypothetical protein [Streptomyces smyrnaeus]|uniref:hypothetical protein n=1 Tax=Streptomyces smyrnaeus TaxID=1387713 RepID=UPI00369AC026